MIEDFKECPECGGWGKWLGYYTPTNNIVKDPFAYFSCEGFAYKCDSCGAVFVVPKEEKSLLRLAQVQILVPGRKSKNKRVNKENSRNKK